MALDKNTLNHSTSHLMAEAIMNLFPEAKLGFGPAIEDGFYYDVDLPKQLTEEDLAAIEKEMRRIAGRNVPFVRKEVSKEEALKLFKDNPYKIELINGIEGTITLYYQGDFFDLCAGPHIERTGQIQNFKLLSIAGAYWRGNSKNKQLQRIYGTSFEKKADLEAYLRLMEERKARDHRRLGKELELFMLSEYGPGFPFWLPNGMVVRTALEDMWKEVHRKYDYMFVDTPIMLSKELWITSGHWDHYKDNMYTTKIDEKEFAIKPMNCPGAILCYKNGLHSYRELPLRYAELGHVHRYEASGALNGLFRVRSFTQDDAHSFVRPDQIESEIKSILKLYDEIYSMFGLNYKIELSTRPEEGYIGSIDIWNNSERILEEACKQSGKEFKINPGDGAFYGPKLDFKVKDCMGRIWQCGTIQLDMNLPERFDVSYVDEKGEKVRPVMLHRACFGSIERFIGILIEHFAGAFPLWLSPEQVRVLPVNNNFHSAKAEEIVASLKKAGIRASLDAGEDKLGYRMRSAQVKKVPYTLVIGDHEVEEGTVTYRHLGSREQITLKYEEFVEMLLKEIKERKLAEIKE
ncbi:MAG: threonine--tRNA ligase [Bacilli bacterium]|nr:threonine--tRNA ligase [Bacilli bacterium]